MWGALSGLGSAIRQRLMILVLEFDRVQAVLIPVLVTVGFPLQAENDCGVLMTSLRKDSLSARAKGKLNFRVSNIAVCHLTSSSRIERPDRPADGLPRLADRREQHRPRRPAPRARIQFRSAPDPA